MQGKQNRLGVEILYHCIIDVNHKHRHIYMSAGENCEQKGASPDTRENCNFDPLLLAG